MPRARRAALALLALLLSACSVAFVASYDRITDERLTELHQKIHGVLDQLARAPYGVAEEAYASVRADLRTLRARNVARDRNDLTVAQLDALTRAWGELEALNKTRPLSPAVVDVARSSLDQALRAAIRLELQKRRLLP